jgi:hypothetical protein
MRRDQWPRMITIERYNDVHPMRPNSHSKRRSDEVGNLDTLNIALRSEGQIDTGQPDGGTPEELNHQD